MTALLYLVCILSWGTTWIAIKWQLGYVPIECSICYRFVIASFILLLWCLWKKRKFNFSLSDHGFIALQAAGLFSINYFMAYYATEHLTTGINAVIFSIILIFNIINSAIFFRDPINTQLILAAFLGIGGLALVFWPEVSNFDLNNSTAMGLGFSLAGALLASFGNILSSRNQRNGLPVMETNAIGMGYGAMISIIWAVSTGKPMLFDTSLLYIGSLFYLSIVGSIIAFGCYLTLIGRVGPAKAAYPLVVVPVVALLVSEIFEDYHWTIYSLIGVVIITVGNILVSGVRKPQRQKLA